MLESFCPSVKINIRDFGKYDEARPLSNYFKNIIKLSFLFQKRTSRIIMFKKLPSMNNSTFIQSSPKQSYMTENWIHT